MDKKQEYKIIHIAEPDLTGREVDYVTDSIRNGGRISSSGKYLDKFEEYCRQYFGRKFALATSNGTTALHLALLSLGVGVGDEVIVPTLTFAATAAVVVHCGAKPVFFDVKQDDWLIDENLLDTLYTPKTKALIAVDLYGLPCNYNVINVWCKKRGVLLIEDAAEAHGAFYDSKPVGSFGAVSCFSFFGNKIITTGEGGILLTDNEEVFLNARTLRNHGMKVAGTYLHDVAGFNYRLTNLQAAVGCAQFERFEEFKKNRAGHYALYRELLADVPEVTFQKYDTTIVLPAHWLTTVLLSVSRDFVSKYLLNRGIDSRPIFVPMHKQVAYLEYVKDRVFPVADKIAKQGISLPSSTLLSDDDIRFVCTVLKEAIARASKLG